MAHVLAAATADDDVTGRLHALFQGVAKRLDLVDVLQQAPEGVVYELKAIGIAAHGQRIHVAVQLLQPRGQFVEQLGGAFYIFLLARLSALALFVLAVLAIVGGALNLPPVFHAGSLLYGWLSPVVEPGNAILEARHFHNHPSHAAEWVLLGVGAAIALGSQKWNGTCADFVKAPARNSNRIGRYMGCSASDPSMAEIWNDPVAVAKRMIPARNARPPVPVTSSA